jgi:hypothetical protein
VLRPPRRAYAIRPTRGCTRSGDAAGAKSDDNSVRQSAPRLAFINYRRLLFFNPYLSPCGVVAKAGEMAAHSYRYLVN